MSKSKSAWQRMKPLIERGMVDREVAAVLGVTASRVGQVRRQHGVPSRTTLRRKARLARIRECEGMTSLEASERLGVSVSLARELARQAGVKLVRPKPQRGSQMRERTKQRLLKAEALADGTLTLSQAAARIGYSAPHLNMDLRRYRPDLLSGFLNGMYRDGRTIR